MAANILPPRDYQTACMQAICGQFDQGVDRPAVVLPTGAGKTVVFSHLTAQHIASTPGRVLILAHTDELVLQAASKIKMVAPHLSVGIVKAERNEVHARVIVASVQSLRTEKRRSMIKNVSLIIVDECHHATAVTYMNILRHYGALPAVDAPADWSPTCRAVGFTATLMRADKAKLSEVWQDVAFRKDMAFMIRRGYLLDVVGKRIEVPDFDLSKIRMRGGDYSEGDLGQALTDSLAPEIVAKAYAEQAGSRKGLLFAPTVESAYEFEAAFRDQGMTCETVHGGLARDARRGILARLRTGETQVVSNCAVLIEGFDEPTVDVVVIARPTKSAPLYQQMIGRVMRPDLTVPPAERGKALIMDVTGVSRRHDLRSLVDLSPRAAEKDVNDLPELEEFSLLELEDFLTEQEEAGAGSVPVAYHRGPVEIEEFDPLARDSDRAWKKTTGGTYYLTTGDRYVFLAESTNGEPGMFDVVWCTTLNPCVSWEARRMGPAPHAGLTKHRGLPFDQALVWAEDYVMETGAHGIKTFTSKKAAWRRREPGESALKLARSLKADIKNGMTAGEVADAIDLVKATRRIDVLVEAVRGQ